MAGEIKRRQFISGTAMGAVCMHSLMRPVMLSALPAVPKLKVGGTPARVGRLYVGNSHPGWPMATVDLEGDMKRFEAEFANLKPALEDIEFVDAGLVTASTPLEPVMEKFKDVDGILAIHLGMGVGGIIDQLLTLNHPMIFFAPLYSGHEWHTIAARQRQGKKIECLPSGDYNDLATAVRPFRAIHRLKEAKVLYIHQSPPNAEYVQAIKEKFGTQILNIDGQRLVDAYHAADEAAALADAERWINEAEKIVEPTREEIIKASRMYLALVQLLQEEQADAITINCLGMGLVDRGMAYPCLGFSRLDNIGLGGICEADLKSTMTHLIFQTLTGKPGFVTDPVIDLSDNTVIHAHCVSPLNMDGVDGEQCPYIIRNHLEDAKGVSLQVKMKLGQPIALARLIGTDKLLYSQGEIVENPDSDRGCRTKIRTKVADAQRLMENYSCGLHRVVFYGDFTSDLKRFCRFKDIQLVWEEKEDVHDIPGLEWEPYVHA
ncbi:MAG: hypothetical protein RBU29_04845 [bacterium]|nr:hypothetical protein [bacterium]